MFWDFNVGRAQSRGKIADAASGRGKDARRLTSTEEMMPFYRVDGGLLRVKDGSSVAFLTYPGDNLSLKDDHQKAEYAARNAQVLSGLTADTIGIWIVPTTVNSKANLAKCDERIRQEQQAVSTLGNCPEAEPHKRSLDLLLHSLRPSLQQSAVSSDEIVINAFIGLKFRSVGDREIENSVSNFQQAFSKQVGKSAVRLGEYEIYDFIDTWVKGGPTGNRSILPKVIMPAAAERQA